VRCIVVEYIKEVIPLAERIHHYKELDSTNTRCRELAQAGALDGTVVIADHQTAGRGRMGRDFESPAGLGLYLSVLWRPDCPLAQLLPLTALAAVAAMRAVRAITGTQVQIKWPNDLVLQGKKIAGILTETSLRPDGSVDYVVLGIGINCHHTALDFSPEVAEMASSLDVLLGGHVSRRALADTLVAELDTLRHEILPQPALWLSEYRRTCLTLGKTVRLPQTGETVTAVDVDENYGLIVRHTDGTETVCQSGEVSVRGLYGYAE